MSSSAPRIVQRLFSETVFELPLSPSYVRHWGMTEAVRELIQNAIDSESPFEWELSPSKLRIISRFSKLDPKTLLLGSTSKADSTDSIGSFGEGYKIALLVLAREKYLVTVYNGDVVWRPEFRHSKKFDSEVLCIVQTLADERREGLEFSVALAEGDAERIQACALQLQGDIGEIAETPSGRILFGRPGKLYVGGLYICDTELNFGYDVKPNKIKLERDRQTVSGFDLSMLAKQMWFETERHDQIATLIEAKCPDLEYAHFGTPLLVKEACYRHFCEQHPGKVIARDNDELQKLVKAGMKVFVSVSDTQYHIVTSHRAYAERVQVRQRTPADMLITWLAQNRVHMTRKAIDAMQFMIKHAEKNWRNV